MFGSSASPPAEGGQTAQAASGPAAESVDFSCPQVRVRAGASTFQVSANPAEPSPVNMRYQVGIGETARECRRAGPDVVMRVGIQGRVIIGPQGGPGQIDVPLRLAVVREGVEPRPIVTDLYRLNVIVPQGDTNVAFTHIEDRLTFPMPPGAEIDAYVVYVGFDPLAARAPQRRR